MNIKRHIFKFIISGAFFLWSACCSAIAGYENEVLRRVKTESFSLLTSSDIEKAIQEAGGWPQGQWVDDVAQIKRLWGQDIRKDKELLIRKKYLRSGNSLLFDKYIVIQLLDEYFVKTGAYSINHITPALALSDDGRNIYYISVQGHEGFSWEQVDYFCARLEEWDSFVGAFNSVGFDMQGDVTDVDNGRISKNIILEVSEEVPDSAWEEYMEFGQTIYTLPKQWKRIDLDGPSCYHNYRKSKQFFADNAESLRAVLGEDKYRLLELAYRKYSGDIDSLTTSEKEEFDTLLAGYQHEVLRGYFP